MAKTGKAVPRGSKPAPGRSKPVKLTKAGGAAKGAPRRRGGAGRPPGLRRLVGRATVVAVLMLLGLLLVGVGAQKLAYAAGWAGTAGTVRVVSCHDEGGSDSPSWACSGVYRSGDGSTVDRQARVKPPGNEQGHTIDVRHMSGHDYSATGSFALVTPLVLIVFGALVLTGIVWGGPASARRWAVDVRAARERARRAASRGEAGNRA